MSKLTAVLCSVLLLVGAASAFPGVSWRRAAEESSPDRDVEVLEPVRGGGSRGGVRGVVRGGLDPDNSEEGPQLIPIGIGFGLRGIGALGGGPVLAIRPFGPVGPLGPRDSDEASASDDSDEDLPTGVLRPYFVDPMSNFMAQMAEMMAAMRRQMNQVLSRVPNESTDFSKLGNTTSTTKVIDGHVITVNETVLGGEDGDDSVVHIRVIDVHPSESPESAEGASPTPASSEDSDEGNKKPASDSGSAKGSDDDSAKDVESLGDSDEATPRPNRADNEIPMKVGSEVDDLNA